MKQRIKLTYATLRNDNPELHDAYDASLQGATEVVRTGRDRHR